jgi:lipopolysaccharide biosynthesis regulator YciM
MSTQKSKAEDNGQHSTLGNLDKLVDEFDRALRLHDISITPGSELEAACLSITDLSD